MAQQFLVLQSPGNSVYGSVTINAPVKALSGNPSRRYLRINSNSTYFVTFDGSTPSATNGFVGNSNKDLVFEKFVPTGDVTIASVGGTITYQILWA